MNSKKVKSLRREIRARGGVIDDGGVGRGKYRALKRAANAPQFQFVKALPASHSHRTTAARVHKALAPKDRVAPWREVGPLIVAAHPQRPRRPGRRRGASGIKLAIR